MAAGVVAAVVVYHAKPRREFGSSESPIRLRSVAADVFHLDASAITQRGPSRFVVVRLDGPVELVPHHFAAAKLDGPMTIGEWAEQTGAPILFNAGQFDDELNHLGWLKADGAWIAEHRKKKWKGLLVSGPLDGAPWAGVVDLEQSNPNIADQYRHVVQSMMLVDDKARVRVRDSDKTACRTVVAQDDEGRILIMVSEGAMTLGDLARWLPTTGLGIVRAMNLDGGIEAQLAVATPELTFEMYGQYGTGTTVFQAGPGQIEYPLPAVVAVRLLSR